MSIISIDEMVSKKRSSATKRWLSEGLFIAGVTFFSYMISLVYEVGYATRFAIPYALIQIDLTTTLLSAGSVLVGLGIFVLVFRSLLFLQQKIAFHDFYFEFFGSMIFIVLTGALIIVIFMSNNALQWAAMVSAAIVGPAIVTGIKYFGRGLYAERRGKYIAREEWRERGDFYLFFVERNKNTGIDIVIFAFLVFVAMAFLSGLGNATYQQSFYVFDTQPEQVVLHLYGDTLVAAPIDRKNKTITNSLVIYDLPKEGQIRLRREHIGPLRRNDAMVD